MPDNTTEPTIQGRSRARRNVIGGSPHRDEYERLMVAGWTSLALERYAAYRFGEDIPASTFRAYKSRKKIRVAADQRKKPWAEVDVYDKIPDVIGMRADMIELQRQRIAIDWQHEQSMGKLFGSTRGEIAQLATLLDQIKSDMQDVGLMPKAGERVEFTNTTPTASAENAPRARTLGELVGGLDPAMEMEMARTLHAIGGAAERKIDGEKAG